MAHAAVRSKALVMLSIHGLMLLPSFVGFYIWSLFYYSVLCGLRVLQPPGWVRESLLLSFNCFSDVLLLLVFCDSSSRFHGLVCSLWLWYHLIILAYFFGLCYLSIDYSISVKLTNLHSIDLSHRNGCFSAMLA